MKKLLLTLFLVLLVLPGMAHDFTFEYKEQTLLYAVLDNEAKTAYVKSGKSSDTGKKVKGDLIIPSKVTDGEKVYTVTSIGDAAFDHCWDMTSVTIPDLVTEICEGAFFHCHGLTSVTIPNSVTSIGKMAFYYCINMTSVTIGNSVTQIGSSAFGCCEGLTSITIPDSVIQIGYSAFARCTCLTSVTIPKSVTSIGYGIFSSCDSLISIEVDSANSNYTSKDGVLFSKDMAILINFPGGVGGRYIIPNSVTSIGKDAFYCCSGLTSITIPNSITSIGRLAFSDCSGLKSMTIPDSVTEIGECAFKGCSGLSSVRFSGSVTSIGSEAFAECTRLAAVYYLVDEPISGDANIFSQETYEKATLYTTEIGESLARYFDPWKNFKNIVSDLSGVEGVMAYELCDVYNMNGLPVMHGVNYEATSTLAPGIYIIRQGDCINKIAVK